MTAWRVIIETGRLFWHNLPLLLIGNLLWLLLSLPLLTLPAATGALFYLVHCVVREETERHPHAARVADFRTGWRRYAWPGTRLVALDLALLALILIPLRFYGTGPTELRWLMAPVLGVLLLWGGMQLYLFPLLIRAPREPAHVLLRRALLLVIAHPVTSLLLGLFLLLVLVVGSVTIVLALSLLAAFVATLQSMTLRALSSAE